MKLILILALALLLVSCAATMGKHGSMCVPRHYTTTSSVPIPACEEDK